MESRSVQIAHFGRDHAPELLALARLYHWGQPGFELHGWDARLLPDGYECPEDETSAELLNALHAWQAQAEQE